MESAAEHQRRPEHAVWKQLRQHPQAGWHPLAPRQVRRAVRRGPKGRSMAAHERRLQALRPRCLPGSLPDGRDHPNRVRHRRHPVGRLQWMPRLHFGLSVRRDRRQSGLQYCAEVHALLRPAARRNGARLLESLPDQVDSVWYHPRASRKSANAGRATAPDRGKQGVSLRRRREDARRAELVLSVGRPTGSLRIAARSEDADAQPDSRVGVYGPGSDRRRPRRHLQFPQSRREGRPGAAAMIGVPSSTWFSAAPHWEWLIALYFFLGGLAGGSYFLSALIDLCGSREHRPLAHLGYYVAFPCLALSGLLLAFDLGRPLRAWHMFIQSNTYRPMFKYWSPMSIGSWALASLGFFAFLSFLGALADAERIPWAGLRALRAPSPAGRIIAVLGGLLGLYVAGYTGVLLAVTNRPIWSDTPLLGLLFVVSAASTSSALMILLAHRSGWNMPGLIDLHRMDAWVIALELVVLIALMVSLGPVLSAWLNVWGVLLAIVIVLGMIAPLVLSWRARRFHHVSMATPALLVLVGGFLLRVVIVFSAQSV